MTSKLLGTFFSLAVAVYSVHSEGPLPAEISFNRDIRPILSENCFACHGPDKAARKADLRLDTQEGAVEVRDGIAAIIPGKPGESELLTRVLSHDPDEIMPPPKSERKLTGQQVALLRRWIAEGAKWEKHWSLIAPKRPELPAVSNEGWCKTPIDRFILARLDREELRSAPEADRTTLIRRVTYDLTGLPPSLAEIETFLADNAPDAYERLVERLLASPRYGEKMAVHWLDLARYADTHGYHLDSGRDMWLWRDWVIEAFNRNLSYNKFVAWQLAGDLLPNASAEQKVATGFVRNNMINFEGGADPQEYHTQYVLDRVNTFGTAFLGLTVACAQCHDHKYDPITQREYYQLYAYFNAVPENGLDGREGNAVPVLELPTPEQAAELERLKASLAAAEKEQRELEKQADAGQREWEATSAKPSGQQRSQKEREELQRQYRRQFWPALIQAQEGAVKLQEEVKSAKKRIPSVMVMAEMENPRETFVLNRGQFNQPGEKVEAGVPASLPALPPEAPKNRLALAQWITDPQHPLMARVTVNRFWKLVMGSGFVKTLNDFGSQAEWPSHPELLDWLATEFTGSGWDVKHLMRLIVTSAAYRQSARVTQEKLQRDPENRLYARGPRFRLSAEEIRDTALAVSGLLNPKIGGPSVSPYQPEGLWEELSSRTDSKKWSAQTFVQSHGPELYRRSMYTFWKRTSPPPQMQTFDAPDRETCVVNRERTNTPLQALVLMNDPTYIEASRLLAERIVAGGGSTTEERVRFAFRVATARLPSEEETAMLVRLFHKQRERYASQRESALRLLGAGEFKRNEQLDVVELAAWTNVASTILNLDETITRG